MAFQHINLKNCVDSNCSNISELDSHIERKKSVTFLLIHMVGCEPCEKTLPEWLKIKNIIKDNTGENVLKKNGIVIADIDRVSAEKLKNVKKVLSFPTILFLKNGKREMYEESDAFKNSNHDNKYKIDTFMEWIFSKCPNIQNGVNKKINKKTKKNIKGGKWSRKYKKNINCKKPKGFSQKQYCKYGRNK